MITLPSYINNLFIRKKKKEFEWIHSDFKVLYGGRGGAKSETLGTLLLWLATKSSIQAIIARETEKDLYKTIVPMMKYLIDRTNLGFFFELQAGKIEGKNGSSITFLGMLDNWDKTKGLNHVDIFWYEEATAISELAYDILIPSIRKENSEIWFSFNPFSRDDIVYKKFVLNTPPKNAIVRKVSFRDNDFHGEKLERQRVATLAEDPLKYAHIWEGELMQGTESSYWKGELLDRMEQGNNREITRNYQRIVVAVDPATTHEETSNEYGIIAVAEGYDGKYYILEDSSGVLTPQEFIERVDILHMKYNAECVVVETNQGGDFIKHAILVSNPHIIIEEVKASKSKHLRALPVAQLSEQGKVFFAGVDFSVLKTQMMLMTSQGYQGKKGESPDRLDALVWGIYYLANLSESDTIHTIYKPEHFDIVTDIKPVSQVNYAYIGQKSFCFLQFDIFENNGVKLCLNDIYIGNRESFSEFAIEKKQRFVLINTKNARAFIALLRAGVEYSLSDNDYLTDEHIEIKVTATLPYIEQNIIYCSSEEIKTKLLLQIGRYNFGNKLENTAVECITSMLAYIYQIENENE